MVHVRVAYLMAKILSLLFITTSASASLRILLPCGVSEIHDFPGAMLLELGYVYLTYCSQTLTLPSTEKHPVLFLLKRSDCFFCLLLFSEAFICEVWLRAEHDLSLKASVQVNNPSLTHHRQPVVSICPS